MSIRTKLWLFVTALVAAILLGNGIVVFWIEVGELKKSFERESETFARLAGPQALRAFGESARVEGDPHLAQKLSAIAGGLPPLKAMFLLSPRGKVLAAHPKGAALSADADSGVDGGAVSMRRVKHGGEEVLELVLPVHGTADSPQVLFKLIVSEAPVHERIRSLALAYFASLSILLILGALLARRLAGHIIKPVESLKAAAAGVRDGDMTSRATASGGGEIAELAEIFNAMAARMERDSAALGQRNEDLEKAYAELQALHEEISNLEKMAAVGRTAAAVSHEIDNPIGVILGTAGMVRKELSERPDLAEDMEAIEAECLRCRRIVRDLLDFARPSMPGGERAVDLAAAAGMALKGLKHHPEMKGIEFALDAPAEPVVAGADPDGAKQVILNLLINAAKAVGGRGLIEVKASAAQGMAEIAVFDRGPGVARENMERIFTPYFTTGKGAGLGLAISRRLVEQSGGRLLVEAREGGGSIFRARWPLKGG